MKWPSRVTSKEEVVFLSNYKFEKRKLTVVETTPQKKRVKVAEKEKMIVEGIEERNRWGILGKDVDRVGVDTSRFLSDMALANWSTSSMMAREIHKFSRLVSCL